MVTLLDVPVGVGRALKGEAIADGAELLHGLFSGAHSAACNWESLLPQVQGKIRRVA